MRTDSGPDGERVPAEAMASRLGVFIKQAEQALLAEKSRVLRPLGLTVPQYVALIALVFVPDQSAAQLARSASLTPQTMATILGNLESKGLVERAHSPLHAKVLVTSLTSEGRELALRADAEARRVEDRLAGVFTAAEQQQLRDLLQRSAVILRSGAGSGE